MGQFDEIIWHTMIVASFPHGPENLDIRRECARQCLLGARSALYPELHGAGHSYGVGKFPEADKAFDVHQVLRNHLGDDRTPFSYYELPLCEEVGDEKWKDEET